MRTKHVRWNGDEWVMSELSPDFSLDIAGGTFVIDDDQKIHLFAIFRKPDAHWLDLGYTYSEDNGKTWKPVKAITCDANSREIHYVSPSAVSINSILHIVYTRLYPFSVN
jgi:hypothetical protein